MEKIREPLAVTGYCCTWEKFLASAEMGIRAPERHLTRADQMKSLPRYAGRGVLGKTQPDGVFSPAYTKDGWRKAQRTMARHIASQYYEPIPVEPKSTSVAQTVQTAGSVYGSPGPIPPVYQPQNKT